MKIYFATGNKNKFREVEAILGSGEIQIEPFSIQRVEVQSENLESVARFSLQVIKHQIPGPCFVEDAGLFIDTLNGFPGPYSSYVFKKIGNQGILDLLKGKQKREATFKSAIAYCRPDQEIQVVLGETIGHIGHEIRGKGWGFDPIFVPGDKGGKTYGEMAPPAKNQISHRRKALDKLRNILLEKT